MKTQPKLCEGSNAKKTAEWKDGKTTAGRRTPRTMIRRNEYAAQTMRGEDCQEEDGRVEGWKNHGRKKNTKNNETEK